MDRHTGRSILYISPYNPFSSPLGAGSQVVRYRLEKLTQIADVHLLTFSGNNESEEKEAAAMNVTAFFAASPFLNTRTQPFPTRLFQILSGRVVAIENMKILAASLAPAVREVTGRYNYALVHIDDIIIASLLKSLPRETPVVVFLHNLLTRQYRNIYRSRTDPLKTIAAYLEYLWIMKYERRLFRRIKRAVVLTAREYGTARAFNPHARIDQIPLEIDTRNYIPSRDKIEKRRIVMTGTMSYEPNHEGAMHFIKKIFPLIQEQVPAANFYAVGMNPRSELIALGNDHVKITGMVPDIREEIHKAEVVVVPILAGGGMRFKILEAFALGKAVVSTPVGAEGIEYEDRKDIFIADDPAGFARSTCDLLADSGQREALGAHARRLAVTTYDTDVVWSQWRRIYDDMLQESPAGERS